MATSFNIEQAVEKHIAAIASEGNLSPDDIKELAGHLIDSVTILTKQGLSDEEAFMVATKRLGTQQQLVKEYEKVNPTMKVNRIWGHLIFGFATLTGLWGFGKALLIFTYGSALKNGNVTQLSLFWVAAVHLALCLAIGLVIYHKRAIAAFLQRKLQRRPLLMLIIAILLMTMASLAQNFVERNTENDISFFALNKFQSPYVEFTFYLLLSTLFIGLVSMFFTVKNPENATLKRMFSRPSIWFLLVAGFATELLAASTRVLPPHNAAPIAGLYFGAIYFIGAFAISYYNRIGVFKYLCWYGILGLALEMGVGIQADLSRINAGYPIMTPYFVFGLLAGLAGGYIVGRNTKQTVAIVS
jgi:hypothetical protein